MDQVDEEMQGACDAGRFVVGVISTAMGRHVLLWKGTLGGCVVGGFGQVVGGGVVLVGRHHGVVQPLAAHQLHVAAQLHHLHTHHSMSRR